MQKRRSPAAEIELARRRLNGVDRHLANLEQLGRALARQQEDERRILQEHERTIQQYERIRTLGEQIDVLPLDQLPKLLVAVAFAQAEARAKEQELEAARKRAAGAEEAASKAFLALQSSKRSLEQLQQAQAQEQQKAKGWGTRVMGVVKFPVKVVKAPLQLLDDLGEERPSKSLLTGGEQVLLKQCEVVLDESTNNLARQEQERAQTTRGLTEAELRNAQLEARIKEEVAKGLQARIRAEEVVKREAALKKAAEDLEQKKKEAAQAEISVEEQLSIAREKRQEIGAASKKAEEEGRAGQAKILQLAYSIQDAMIEELELELEKAKAETELSDDKNSALTWEGRLAEIRKGEKSLKDLADIEGEQTSLTDYRDSLTDKQDELDNRAKKIGDRLKAARARRDSVDGNPSETHLAAWQLPTEAMRKVYLERFEQHTAILARQHELATALQQLGSQRVEIVEQRRQTLAEAHALVTEELAAALWKTGERLLMTETVEKVWHDLKIAAPAWVRKTRTSAETWWATHGPRRAGGIAFAVLFVLAATWGVRKATRRVLTALKDRLKQRDLDRWWNRALLSGPYVLNRSMSVILLCGLAAGAARGLVRTPQAQNCLLATVGLLAAFRVLHALSSACFGVHRGASRVFRWNDHFSSHLHRVLATGLLLTTTTIVLAYVLKQYHYDEKVIKFSIFLYKLLLVALLIGFFSHPIFIQKLMPQATTWLGRTVRLTLTVLYPPTGVFVLVILAAGLAGYGEMAKALAWTLLWSVLLIFGAFLLSRWVMHRMRHRRARPEPDDEHGPAAAWGHLLTLLLVVLVALLVVHLWHERFHQALTSPAAPKTVQLAAQGVAKCKEVALTLLHKDLPLGGDDKTTPTQIMVGLLVGLVGFFLASLARRVLDRSGIARPFENLGAWHTVRACVYYLTLAVAIGVGLMVAGIPVSALTVFAGAFGIGIGFGMQNIISNFISGIIILFEQPIRPRDFIDVDDRWSGWVRRIGARSTTIETRDNVNVVVPNSKFVESTVINWRGRAPRTRVHVPVGVAYGSDVPKVERCLLQVAEDHADVLRSPKPEVWFMAFDNSSLNFELLVWVATPDRIPQITSDLNFAIDDIFRENDVTIPFPQRDLHLKSSIPIAHQGPEANEHGE